MKIKLKGNFKSLSDFESEELAPFTVITGKNGSGKSQLVEMFKLVSSGIVTKHEFSFDTLIHPNKIIIEGIRNPIITEQENAKWREKIKFNFKKDNYSKERIELYLFLFENDIWLDELYNEEIIKNNIVSEDYIKDLLIKFMINDDHFPIRIGVANSTSSKSKENHLKKEMSFKDVLTIFKKNFKEVDNDRKKIEVSKIVANYRNKDIRELEDFDFYKTPIPDYYLDKLDLFGMQIETLFYNYSKRRDINNINFLSKREYNDVNESISDNDFISKNKQPWKIINEIFEKHNIDFEFKGIERKDFTPDEKINYWFFKKSIDQNISMDSLSSGEQIIIGLIIKLFIANYYDDKLEFPTLIILDEPDANLHPEMSKLLIDVLNETFVNDKGIKIIMTTHSPSTIALCPEDSIYQLNNTPKTSLKKIDKDSALELLTGFLPTLSIDYKNHRQIFVESETDVFYYQEIFNKIKIEKKYIFNLYFISNSNGKGNSDLVKEIVKQIRNSGNKTTYGIIDWDLKNNDDRFVKVHGENKLYSIENYIYNPIYLVIYFMQERGANNVYKELKISDTINHLNIGNESDDFLQKISDWFFQKYYERFKSFTMEEKNNLVEFYFLNDRKIKVPNWFLKHKGHDLEKQLKEIFPSLNKPGKSEGDLQKEIIKVISKCYPFIPKDSVDLIDSLMN